MSDELLMGKYPTGANLTVTSKIEGEEQVVVTGVFTGFDGPHAVFDTGDRVDIGTIRGIRWNRT